MLEITTQRAKTYSNKRPANVMTTITITAKSPWTACAVAKAAALLAALPGGRATSPGGIPALYKARPLHEAYGGYEPEYTDEDCRWINPNYQGPLPPAK